VEADSGQARPRGGGNEHAAAQAPLTRGTAVATGKDERVLDGIARTMSAQRGSELGRQRDQPCAVARLSAWFRKYGDVLASGFARNVRGILSSREGALMPRHSPYRIELSDEERAVLESLARSYTLPYWQVTRAQMVLMAADGMRNDEIAARLRCGRDVVSQWRKRFYEQRLAGLEDRPRRGRPPAFPPSRAR
jgi:hypothetical protein